MLDDDLIEDLRTAAARDRLEFAAKFYAAVTGDPLLGRLAPVILYATLGPALPNDAAQAAVLWGVSHQAALRDPVSIKKAGIAGEGPMLGEALFDRLLTSPRGAVFSTSEPDDSWRRVTSVDGKLNIAIPEMLQAMAAIPDDPIRRTSDDFPLVLAAGERRSFTANTIFRDPEWRKRDREGALRMSVADAREVGVVEGGSVRVSTAAGSLTTTVEISDTMQPGHISLPNGLGVDYPDDDGQLIATGVALNELTSIGHQDAFAGTPWHKHVPARVEAVG